MSASVKFILGRSGSGKTHAVFSAIIERELRGEASVLIVPDRATFETERALGAAIGEAAGRPGGMMHTSVVSFTRLASRVLSETGSRHAFLSSEGRLMLLRRILDENKTALNSFARVCTHRGFAKECDEIILKCKRFSIEPQELFEAKVPERLKKKLTDFALIYQKLGERMRDRYIDGEDLVNSLVDRIPLSSLRGAAIFIDAPDMLSAQSLRIIEKFFYSASSVVVTFRADVACREANAGLFLPDLGYYGKLLALANEAGCAVETVRLMGNKRHASAALAHLETVLFSHTPAVFTESAREIELHGSIDSLHEVQEAAAVIRAAVLGGLRYRDIAVAVNGLSAYAETIRRAFKAADIPFFIDAKRRVASHPVAELILAALRCAEKGFRGEDFIRVMKTGLTDFSDETLEKLENHILRFALCGSRLTSEEPSVVNASDIKDLDEIERARIAIAKPLLALRERLGEDGSRAASVRAAALYAYLEDMRIAEKLMESFERLKQYPDTLPYALENRQVYNAVIELLDQIHVIIGDEPIGLSRFASVVREGLEAYEIAIIPPTLDQVQVGDVSSIHPADVRFLLVLGAGEGRFPALREDNRIINDRELEAMQSAGLKVWESTASMDAAERLRVYSLLCRARERLYLSFVRDSGSVDELARSSSLIKHIGGIFKQCRRNNGKTELSSALIGASSDETAFAALAEGLRSFIDTGDVPESELASLYAHFKASEKYAPLLSRLEASYYSREAFLPLGAQTALELYGRRMTGSVSRLETFNKCPYRHLMQFGLDLSERKVHGMNSADYGTLVHDALDKLVSSYIAELEAKQASPADANALFASLTVEDIDARLNTILPELVENFLHGLLLESASMRAELARIRRMIRDSALAIMRQLAAGRFRPYKTELSFGMDDKENSLPALEIEGSGGVVFRIRGVIDRVDLFTPGSAEEDESAEYFRIVDYKTYDTRFDFMDLEHGLRVQLPLYAAAVEAGFEASRRMSAAGFYYQHIHAPKVTVEAERESTVQNDLRLHGPTLKEEAVIRATDEHMDGKSSVVIGLAFNKKNKAYTGRLLVTTGELESAAKRAKTVATDTLNAIMQGRADISPYRRGSSHACTACSYSSVCRFDTMAGDRFRRLRSFSKDEFFERHQGKEEKTE